jgi:nucleoside-diphosphate-sugar epimerase
MTEPLIEIIEKDVDRIFASVNLWEIKGKSILVTGASGLLGLYFLACLRKLSISGHAPSAVVAVVHSDPIPPLNTFINFDGAKVIQGDLTDPSFSSNLGKFDFIIHAAGYGQPGRFMEDRVKTLKLNTLTTFNLFDCLNTNGRFLFLSSSEIYSGNPSPPYLESQIGQTNTTHMRSCYIEGKRGGEAICNAYRDLGINAYSARLALAYGPGTKPTDKRVINSFIERGLLQKKISLQDMGVAKRTYCYISDAVEILWNILLNGTEPVYNVGGQSRITIAELANKIGNYLNVPVEFPARGDVVSGAPEDVFLDMALVAKEFKKTGYVDFNEGLARTIEWQKRLYSSEISGV